MQTWSQANLHKHMHVYSSDNTDLGHILDVYEDSFKVAKGLLFHTDRYFPYSAIGTVDNDRVQLNIDAQTAQDGEWVERPDYEDHPGDPTQLMYDRGHGIHDPFDESNPDKA